MPEIEELSSSDNDEIETLRESMDKVNIKNSQEKEQLVKNPEEIVDKVTQNNGGDEKTNTQNGDNKDKKDEKTEEIEVLTEDERRIRIEKSKDYKSEGNRLFKINEYEASVEQYKYALKVCPKDHTELRVILCSNIAAATDHLGMHDEAIEYCNEALKLNPKHVKALLRRAQLYRKCDKLDESQADYTEYCKLAPDDKPAKRVLHELSIQINERNEKLKTEMLGKLKDLGNMFLKPFGLSTENFQMVKNPETGNYSVNFNNGNKS